MLSHTDSFFDKDEVYSRGLNYAFGISDYGSSQEPIEDPSYGVLLPYYKSWGGLREGVSGVDFEPLPTRECTEAEFHINNQTDPNSKFYAPFKSSVSDLEYYWKTLKCIDVDEITVQGDYNSP